MLCSAALFSSMNDAANILQCEKKNLSLFCDKKALCNTFSVLLPTGTGQTPAHILWSAADNTRKNE